MSEADQKLHRVTIYGYKDKDFTQSSSPKSFEIPINPEQLTQNLNVNLDTGRGHGNLSSDSKFTNTPPEQVKLDFTLDNTGAVSGNKLQGTPVRTQVDMMLKVLYKMNGEIHQPNFLKVLWGTNALSGINNNNQAFTCKLGSLSINYTLIDNKGEPLRAKISATLVQYIESKAEAQIANRGSPDLTRIRKINEGDKLSLMTFEIYSDQSYYQKVARANGLTTFRKLKAGDFLVFPPIA